MVADRTYDVIVVGAGAMGSAAGWWLARRGHRVLVIDQFGSGHTRGSSHGASRIFRFGYAQPEYTEMALEALSLWRELERHSGERVLDPLGAIDHGPGDEVGPIRLCYERCGVAHEVLGPQEAAHRWPGMRFEGEVLYQPDGARIRADLALRVLHDGIVHHGGQVRMGAGRAFIEPHRDRVRVRAGDLVASAPAVVVAAGPWTAETLSGLVPLPPLTVTREQVFYFAPASASHPWPCFIHRGEPTHYGLDTPGRGIKVAEHHTGSAVTADGRSFEVEREGAERLTQYVRTWMPGLRPQPSSFETCLYTSTATEDFVVDRHERLIVAAGFSGHGFKFTPLIGKLLAGAVEGTGDMPALFRFSRPQAEWRGHL